MKSVVEKIIQEPIIRVGIILPEDKMSETIINFSNPARYKISSETLSGRLIVKCQSDSILINNKITDPFLIEPNNNHNENDFIIINSVPIGLGFHWQKKIQVQLPGKIIIKNYNSYLFVINELPLEQYLPYVATSEMAPDCPPALLAAQTIAARSWLLANRKVNHPELDIDVCNDDCCQRYQGVTNVSDQSLQSIRNTCGQVLRYRNKICDARYSKCCGGITESYENVWGGKPIPYLSSVTDIHQKDEDQRHKNDLMSDNEFKAFLHSSAPTFCSPSFVKPEEIQKYLGKVDKPDSYYRWEITYSQDELTSIINNKLDLNAKAINKLTSFKRGFSGRIIKLKIEYVDKSNKKQSLIFNSEYAIRNALNEEFLYSSAILIEQKTLRSSLPLTFKFMGSGWGHGVGLCQIGALGMALNGYSARDILKHYFINTKIEKIY